MVLDSVRELYRHRDMNAEDLLKIGALQMSTDCMLVGFAMEQFAHDMIRQSHALITDETRDVFL